MSRRFPYASAVTVRLFLVAATVAALGFAQNHPRPRNAPLAKPHAVPLFFEQHGDRFLARGANYGLQLEAAEAQLALHTSLVRIRPAHANTVRRGVPEDRLPGSSNYYLGNDPKAWLTSLPHFGRIRYREVYDGVDLVFYPAEGQIEFDFVVATGADPASIGLSFDGISMLRIGAEGELLLQTPAGTIRLRKPVAYQDGQTGRMMIAASYKIGDDGAVRFELGPYDTALPLVIDPVLDFSSLLGGNDEDWVGDMDFDANGNILLCGGNGSTAFPVDSPLTPTSGGWDAFIMKLTPDAGTVLYYNQVGGSNDEDYMACRVQPDGYAVMSGTTRSNNFPIMAARQSANAGGYSDSFVTRFDPNGSLLFSTYLGGTGEDGPSDITVDAAGNIYVAGWTDSANYPRQNPIQNVYGGGDYDGVITKYSATGGAMLYSTMFGGNGEDYFNAIEVDDAGSMYGTGYTDSINIQTPVTAFQRSNAGQGDAFALKLNQAGNQRVFFTYLGGSDYDEGLGVDLDSAGNMYIAGATSSNNFPVLSIQAANGGGQDSFLTKVNSSGTGLVHSTYLGGSGDDRAFGVAVNAFNEAYVAGWTESANFPTLKAWQPQKAAAEDAFFYKVNAAGSALVYSTFLGAAGEDGAYAVATDRVGGVIAVGGYTFSLNFPMEKAIQTGAGAGSPDGFLSIYVEAAGTDAARYNRGQIAPGSIAAVFGKYYATGNAEAPKGTSLPSLLGVTVKLADSQGTERQCGLFYIYSDPAYPFSQIDFYVDPQTALGPALITVTASDGNQYRGSVGIVSVAPGLFSKNSNGTGVAAANVARLRNGEYTYTEPFKAEGGVFVPDPIDLGPEGDQVYLWLYGTGLRNAVGATATIGGENVAVFGPQAQGQYDGLDQMNIGPIPRTLIGHGVVNINAVVGGKATNTLTVAIQ